VNAAVPKHVVTRRVQMVGVSYVATASLPMQQAHHVHRVTDLPNAAQHVAQYLYLARHVLHVHLPPRAQLAPPPLRVQSSRVSMGNLTVTLTLVTAANLHTIAIQFLHQLKLYVLPVHHPLFVQRLLFE
jgi:hypothetical protein